MFAHRSVLRGPSAAARNPRSSRLHSKSRRNASRVRSFIDRHRTSLQLEALEQRQLLTATVVSVDTTADVVDPVDGFLSLREAVIEANASPNDYEIQLPAGTYTLTRQGANENAALTGDLDILNNGSVKIVGAGAGLTTIDGAGLLDVGLGYGDRILDVTAGATLSLSGVTLTRGYLGNTGDSPRSGGGIRNRGGQLYVEHCVITQSATAAIANTGTAEISHTTISDSVGGILNGGTIAVSDSRVSGNSGIGIEHSYGTATISDTSIEDNQAGGVSSSDATTTLLRSTIARNTGGDGAGVRNVSVGGESMMTIVECEIVDNVVATNSAGSGGVWNTGTLSIERSLISRNTGGSGGGVGGRRIMVVDSQVTGNFAVNHGGGLWLQGDSTLLRTVVSGNIAAGLGGGVYLTEAYLTESANQIVDSTFSRKLCTWPGRCAVQSS